MIYHPNQDSFEKKGSVAINSVGTTDIPEGLGRSCGSQTGNILQSLQSHQLELLYF